MKRIGILSDTHGIIIPQVFDFFKDVDEVWHAGDLGNIAVAEQLEAFKPLRAVHGNIDDYIVRLQYPEDLFFKVEDAHVYMTHIGGYPGHYMPEVKIILEEKKPELFVCGHSHILKVIYDKKLDLLHINPGAAGNSGFQKKTTMIRFAIDGKQFKDMEIFEIDRNRLF
ncbi:MAG: metallophosphoesterase family protein [Bacteroidales bacterium]|nr:metallophosphoesterase family protein [Bacteroidales bacterium]